MIVDLNNKKEEDLPYSGDSPLFVCRKPPVRPGVPLSFSVEYLKV